MTREVFPGVTVDPDVSWGQPCVRGIATKVIAGRFRAGEHVEELAKDYALTVGQIQAALRWELLPPRARSKRLAGQ